MQMYNSRIVVYHRHYNMKFDFTQRERASKQKRASERERTREFTQMNDGFIFRWNVVRK